MSITPENRWWWVLGLWVVVAVVGGLWWLRRRRRQEILRRVYAEDDAAEARRIEAEQDPMQRNWLSRWLYLAGFRSQPAPVLFVLATVACTAVGISIAIVWQGSGLVEASVRSAESVPGGVGEMAGPVLISGPWILCAFWAFAPYLLVSSERKKRVRAVEQDLPTTLDLLATMSESGLAFDSALDKVILSQKSARPLTQEFQTFQLEVLSGIPRVQCFRRLSQRLEVAA